MAKKPAESPAASPSLASVEPDQLSSVLESLGVLRRNHQVRVYRINDEGHAEAVRGGKFTADKVDEYVISERFGAGEYRADVVDQAGRIIRQVRVRGDGAAGSGFVDVAPEPTVDVIGEFRRELAGLRDVIARVAAPPAPTSPSTGLDLQGVAALIGAIRAGQDGLKPSDLVSIITQQQARTPMSELLAGLRELQGLAGAAAGGADDGDGELPEAPGLSIEETFIREMVSLGREFVALQREKRGAKSPAPKRVENEAQRTEAAAPPKPAKRTACERLAILVGTNAAAEIDPQLCAQAVAFFVGSNQAELRTQFDFAQPLAAQLIDKAPGLKAHAEYVASVEAAVRAMAAGAAGGDHDDDEDDDQDDTSTGAEAGGDSTGSNT